MSEAAADVYEIVLEETAQPKKFFRSLIVLVIGLFSMGAGPSNPGGMIISVRRKGTGEELFRHIEDFGDDEGHLLDGIQKDLGSMSVADFESTWIN